MKSQYLDKEKMNEKGFLILDDPRIGIIKRKLRRKYKTLVYALLKDTSPQLNSNLPFNEFVTSFNLNYPEFTGSAYELFPQIPYFSSLNNEAFFIETLKELGYSDIVNSAYPNFRFDRPNDDYHLVGVHQDIWFSMRSQKSCVFWFLLNEGLIENIGNLLVAENTHQQGIIKPLFESPDNSNPFYLDSEDFDLKSVVLKENEVLLFDARLVHQSGINSSEYPRLTVQLRFQDLAAMYEKGSSVVQVLHSWVKNKQEELREQLI